MKYIFLIFLIFIQSKNVLAVEAYFDLSEKEIQIQTDFNGKEIIIFGIFEEEEDTIITIQGPEKDNKLITLIEWPQLIAEKENVKSINLIFSYLNNLNDRIVDIKV